MREGHGEGVEKKRSCMVHPHLVAGSRGSVREGRGGSVETRGLERRHLPTGRRIVVTPLREWTLLTLGFQPAALPTELKGHVILAVCNIPQTV